MDVLDTSMTTRQDRPITEETKMCLGLAQESSQRARSIVFVLTAASIVTFIAWWNHYDRGWSRTRLVKAQAALYQLCAADEPFKEGSEDARICDMARAAKYGFFTPEELKQGAAFVKRMRFTRKQLDRHVQNLQDHFVAGVSKIGVPFFGIQTDVNDLGIFSGIAFVTLLALFLYAVWREEQNIGQLFHLAKERGELRAAYDLFAMSQVFTVPPVNNLLDTKYSACPRPVRSVVRRMGGRSRPLLPKLTSFLYWMPAIVYIFVGGYDVFVTITNLDEFTTKLDVLTISIEFVALCTILMLRYLIGLEVAEVDAHWRNAHDCLRADAPTAFAQASPHAIT